MDLKQHAKSRGLKQKQIAVDLGVSEGTISKWINREATVPTVYLRRFADVLGIDVGELIPSTDVAA